jgi:hypothetical protein
MYKMPYPSAYDQIPLPHKYKLPDFTKFSGQGEVSTVEHVNRFIMQCGEVAHNAALKVRLFSMSLSVVYNTSSQLYIFPGRSGETIRPVLLLWRVRDEADRFDKSETKEQ